VLLQFSLAFQSIISTAGFVGDSAKESLYRCDETFDRFWLVNIKMFEYSTLKIIDKQRMCRPKTLLEETIWSPEFNNAAIVEYTAAIPEAKQNQQLPFHLTYFFHKLISVRVVVLYIFLSFLFGKMTHVFSIFKYKTRSLQWN
jgi:hypothetical protein